MDIQPPNRPGLEPIQEESELEDETEGNRTREGNEGDFPFQVGVEEEDALAEDESDKDDDAVQLRVLRPGRLSRSLSQFSNHPHEGTESFSVSDVSTLSFALRGEATTPGQPSSKVKIKASKIKWQKPRRSKQPVWRPRERSKKNFIAEEPFPPWLADLMVSIEEATTHQLVVE